MVARKSRISLCMIVRNEEHNLAECLSPVAELFDEIIIIDTGSSDATKEVALRFTPHVYDFPWCDDFAAARNESLRHATGDWVFWLDADDRVRPPHVATICQMLLQLDDQPRVFFLNTVVVPSDSSEVPLLVSHPRLFRRHPALHWRGRVHEQLTPEFAQLGYQQLVANAEIEHVGYQDRVLADRKLRRKLRLLQMEYVVYPNDPSILFHLGMSQCRVGNYHEATKCFLRLLNMNLGAADCLRWVYDALIELSHREGKAAAAARLAERGLALFPDDDYLLLARAKAYYLEEDYASTVRVIEHLMRASRPRQMLFLAPANVKTRLAPLLLGSAYRMQQAYGLAECALQTVINAFPNDCEALFNLGVVYLEQRRKPELVSLLHKLAEAPGGNTNTALLTAMTHLRHGDLKIARHLIDSIIATHPQLLLPRMLRVQLLSRSHASLDDHIRAINDVLRIDPSNPEALAWLKQAEQARMQTALAPAPLQPTSMVGMPGIPAV